MEKVMVYALGMALSLLFTLIITPVARAVNKAAGMVDKPDKRRINKVPIPRGGGWALFLGVNLSVLAIYLMFGREAEQFCNPRFVKTAVLAGAMCLLGLLDDKFGLRPAVKLLGQVLVAVLAWWWAKLGFASVFEWMPWYLDMMITVFWITGAVNAFNLIDGLDGLAAGLALIATLGMGGSLFFLNEMQSSLFYFVFAGGLLGFLRYNYHPASIFLGDSGSMYIGFVIAVLPLCTHHVSGSFLVSVGVPLLAMGVPIFDTGLAIVRRSIRHLILRKEDAGAGKVMTADSDHLHHRILRSTGLSQRKTAWIMYATALFLVAVGLVGMMLKSKTGGMWLLAVTIGTIIIFKDIYRVELFDAGRLLNTVAHDRTVKARRKWAQLAVPFYMAYDILALAGLSAALAWVWNIPLNAVTLKTLIPVRVFSVFVCLAAFNVYRTVWSRAMLSNYLRLFCGCFTGAMIGGSVIYYAAPAIRGEMISLTLAYAVWSCSLLFAVRSMRGIVRDLFYAIDCSRMVGRKDVQRILVYGAGLRYRSFRRELVRKTANNDRIIVGILDDDIVLKGKYIGGIQVKGPLLEAPKIINETNADAVVVACEVDEAWMKIIKETLKPTGVKVSYFSFEEKEI